MIKLNLPEYQFNIRNIGKKSEIYDAFRKRFIVLTPEEWVRQNFLMFLVNEKHFPKSIISVEKGLKVNGMQKRFDIVVFDDNANPRLLVECKAPDVKITQDTFDQAARYNITLNVDYLIVTNGLNHFCCFVDHLSKSISFLTEIPDYQQIKLNNG